MLRCGGERPDDPALADGFFYLPTILDGCTTEHARGAGRVVRPGADRRDASPTRTTPCAIANDSDLRPGRRGLDPGRRQGAAGRRRGCGTGTVWINDYHPYVPQAEWGGFKQSGIGRELGPTGLDGVPRDQAHLAQHPPGAAALVQRLSTGVGDPVDSDDGRRCHPTPATGATTGLEAGAQRAADLRPATCGRCSGRTPRAIAGRRPDAGRCRERAQGADRLRRRRPRRQLRRRARRGVRRDGPVRLGQVHARALPHPADRADRGRGRLRGRGHHCKATRSALRELRRQQGLDGVPALRPAAAPPGHRQRRLRPGDPRRRARPSGCKRAAAR